MKFNIITVAHKMPIWVTVASNEYLKRINHGKYSCNIVEIKAIKNPNKPINVILADEATKIHQAINKDHYIVLLDERGIKFTTQKLANHLVEKSQRHITFIIGGADGVDDTVRNSANLILQLSDLTYPHALVRVIILEQLYRIITILSNHPYHRE